MKPLQHSHDENVNVAQVKCPQVTPMAIVTNYWRLVWVHHVSFQSSNNELDMELANVNVSASNRASSAAARAAAASIQLAVATVGIDVL